MEGQSLIWYSFGIPLCFTVTALLMNPFNLQVLGVLSQDNMMRFINIETCKLLFAIGSHEEGISTAAISPNGRYIASVMENGSVNLYSVQALTQEANKVQCFTFLIAAVNPIKGDTCPCNFCISSSLLMYHWLRSVAVSSLTLQIEKKWFVGFPALLLQPVR